MFKKLILNSFLTCAIALVASSLLTSCGKPIQAAKVNATGGANGNGGGGTITPPINGTMVSCNLTVGTPTFTEVPIKLTVLGLVDKITVDGQSVSPPQQGYTEVNFNYPITSPGPKNVTAFVQNTPAGTANNCTASFVAPDVVDARKTAIPLDGDDYYIYRSQTLISDPDQTTSRYLFAVSKFTGQAYYNSISLDPKYKPGRLDVWKGWQLLPGQGTSVGAILSIIPYSNNSVVISVGALGVGYFATTATCKAGSCNFSAWSEY